MMIIIRNAKISFGRVKSLSRQENRQEKKRKNVHSTYHRWASRLEQTSKRQNQIAELQKNKTTRYTGSKHLRKRPSTKKFPSTPPSVLSSLSFSGPYSRSLLPPPPSPPPPPKASSVRELGHPYTSQGTCITPEDSGRSPESQTRSQVKMGSKEKFRFPSRFVVQWPKVICFLAFMSKYG